MAATPIWKDTYYQVSSANSPYEYSIEMKTGRQIVVNGVTQDEVQTVFNGKAWVRPGDTVLNINVNKVAQDYLYSDLPDLRNINVTTTYENKYACRQFYLVSSAGVTAQTYNFLLDWSYENTSINPNTNLSRPINGHGATNMLYLSTVFNSSQKVVTTIRVSAGSGYDNTHCGNYAIYYLNRYGGWDSFLIEGTGLKVDKYKRYQMGLAYDNTTLDFQKRTYNTEITETYKLNTGWLTDAQSQVLAKHLLSTNQAFLHNLSTGEIMPILSTDGTATYKTFKTNGRKRVNYTINVECSQTKHIVG